MDAGGGGPGAVAGLEADAALATLNATLEELGATGSKDASACCHVGFGGVDVKGGFKPIVTRALTSTLDALKCGMTCLRERLSKSSSHVCFKSARLVPSSDRLLTSVLRSGCADPIPARSCLGAPRPPKGGGYRPPFGRPPPPRYRTRSICRAESESETAERDETLPPDPLRIFCRPGATRVRLCSPPLPPAPDPPSTRAVLAAPLGVTRDTRKGRTHAPLRSRV